MAIRVARSKSEFEAAVARGESANWTVKPYPGMTEPLYLETSHRGLVLALGEYNGRDDSDFYADVWDPAKGAPDRVTYASTRGWTYENGASVDATPEVRAAYEAYRAKLDAAAARHRAMVAEAARLAEEKVPCKGCRCKVVKGRKVPVGLRGTVFWMGAGHYGTRVGLKDDAGTVYWTAASNVERLLDGEV